MIDAFAIGGRENYTQAGRFIMFNKPNRMSFKKRDLYIFKKLINNTQINIFRLDY